MLNHEGGLAQSEKTESNKTRGGSSPETIAVSGGMQKLDEEILENGATLKGELQSSVATHRMSQPPHPKILLGRSSGQGRVAS
jgi:hypothetical protein